MRRGSSSVTGVIAEFARHSLYRAIDRGNVLIQMHSGAGTARFDAKAEPGFIPRFAIQNKCGSIAIKAGTALRQSPYSLSIRSIIFPSKMSSVCRAQATPNVPRHDQPNSYPYNHVKVAHSRMEPRRSIPCAIEKKAEIGQNKAP
jgi:hypothetical protein